MHDDEDGIFACPACGGAMTPGEIGLAGRAGLSISWRDLVEGEPGTPGTLFTNETESALIRPALVCRPCESIFVDFALRGPESTGAAKRTFEERILDIHGEINLDALVAILRAGDPRECTKAVGAFVEAGPRALPVLEQLCQDEDPDVRIDAQRAAELIRQNP